MAASLGLLASFASAAATSGVPGTGSQKVAFATYPPMATADEVLNRLMTPLGSEALRRRIRLKRTALPQQAFDIRHESFTIYVPRHEPAGGYGLLVFVPPGRDAPLPLGWSLVLEKYGIIFVIAERSGNEESVFERRIPLALAALANVQALYRIDPSRTFVGGFSGGSRVAMLIALAYPDKFAGALLDAGSDPIGEKDAPLPAASLLFAFQTRTRLAYATGAADDGALSLDSASLASMRHWCVRNVSVQSPPRIGHEIGSAQVFNWALGQLVAVPRADTAAMASCRDARFADASAALARAESELDAGHKAQARGLLLELDSRFGGLAAPRSVALADRCACGILDSLGDIVPSAHAGQLLRDARKR